MSRDLGVEDSGDPLPDSFFTQSVELVVDHCMTTAAGYSSSVSNGSRDRHQPPARGHAPTTAPALRGQQLLRGTSETGLIGDKLEHPG